MNMKHFAFGVLLLAVLPAIASASCLSSIQVITLNTMLERMNATANERAVFFSAFEDMCTRSYSKNETDQRIGDIYNINNSIKLYMDNYTAWFEERTSGNKALEAIRDMMNATASLAQIDERIDNKMTKISDEMDDRIGKIEDKNDKFITSADLASMRLNMTRDMDYRETQITGKLSAQSANSMNWMLVMIVVAAAAIVVYFKRSQDDRRRKDAYMSAPVVDRNRRQPNLSRYDNPPDLDRNGMPIDDTDERSLMSKVHKQAKKEQDEFVDNEAKLVEREYSEDKKVAEDKLKKMFTVKEAKR